MLHFNQVQKKKRSLTWFTLPLQGPLGFFLFNLFYLFFFFTAVPILHLRILLKTLVGIGWLSVQ